MPLVNTSDRPVYLNLLKIRLPVPGLMSILHRLSGVVMFVALPLLLYLFDRSLVSEAGYREAIDLLHAPPGVLLLFVLLWSLLHHLLAGIRYLLIDIDLGVEKSRARLTAWMVLLGAPLAALLVTWGLLA